MTRGFTLLEVLLAIGIFVAVLAALTRFTESVATGRARVMERAERQQVVDVLIDRLDQVLTTGVSSHRGMPGLSGDNSQVVSSIAQDRPDVAPLAARRDLSMVFNRTEGVVMFNDGQQMSLGDLRLRYLVDDAWVDEFDSAQQGGLPRAIAVEAWFEPVDISDAGERMRLPDRRRVLTTPGMWGRDA